MEELSQKFDPCVIEWKKYFLSDETNLVEKCLKLSQLMEYPKLNILDYLEKLNQIGKALKLNINSNMQNPILRISLFNEFLFQNMGFSGNSDDYYNPENNFLNVVLEKKTGIPITMSIIYSEVARHIGLDLKIVGFPSHVVVKLNEEIILDPFNGGRRLSFEDLSQILQQNYGGKVEIIPEFLNEISPKQVLIRILRNLKNSYGQSYSYEKSLRCIDMILAMEPNSAEEIRDKGILENRFLRYESSLEFLNQYLKMEPNAEDVDFILELIKDVREKINR